MAWYLTDKKRLKAEIRLMEENGVNFQLCTNDEGHLLWHGALTVSGHYHGDVRVVYADMFPSVPMEVYIFEPKLPLVNVHIHENGSICYIAPREWNANWTAFAVYLTTIRFLEEFYAGRMSNEIPMLRERGYTPRSRGLFEKFLDAMLHD